MNKKISLGAAIAFALIVAAAIFSLTMVYSRTETNKILTDLEDRKNLHTKFAEIEDKVTQRYYGDINSKDVEDGFARGYLDGLGDPYAKYYSVEEYATYVQDKGEEQSSVGLEVSSGADGYLEVMSVSLDSPAYAFGIVVGSHIIEVNDTPVTVDNNEELMYKFTGEEGSKVTIVVRTEGEDKFHDLTLRPLEVLTVEGELIENGKIGYIHINSFDSNTSNQFNRILLEMQESMQGLIIDLRGTKGTELGTAPRILDRLVPNGVLISTVNRSGEVQQIEFSDTNAADWPMAVIVNSETAGTAELFAQVLKDYDKAKIVGSATAGRGVLLDIIQLSDGSALEFTVGLYQSPSGVTFDGNGIKPDFEVTLSDLEDKDWNKATDETDTQLIKAIEVVTTS